MKLDWLSLDQKAINAFEFHDFEFAAAVAQAVFDWDYVERADSLGDVVLVNPDTKRVRSAATFAPIHADAHAQGWTQRRAQAFEVIDQMKKRGFSYEINELPSGRAAVSFYKTGLMDMPCQRADRLPVAICKAAIVARLIEERLAKSGQRTAEAEANANA